MTNEYDTAMVEQYLEERTPRNLLGEYNPDHWDPDPVDRPAGGRPTVNTWDPIAGRAVDVPGHRYDRDPDMSEDHARRLALRGEFDDLDDDQPLPLLSSDMRTDPVEGTQGSYAEVIRLTAGDGDGDGDGDPCPECGSDYGIHTAVSTLGGVHCEHCLLCDAELMGP